MFKTAVVLLSGGLDSTTLAYWALNAGASIRALSFDYGQRHKKELEVASAIAQELGIRHDVVRLGVERDHYFTSNMAPLARLLGGSSLTDPAVPVPDGHYAEESMKATVVPNRNAIMLSIAYGVALADKAERVLFAAHAGDHTIYPDCRPEFVAALDAALATGAAWEEKDRLTVPRIHGPFLDMSKTEIARTAGYLNVPIERTWSCYKGGTIHCGTCGTCYERREAIREAGIGDPTEYLDSETTYAAPV